MIPKIIHYCWFGGQPKTAFIKSCIKTWNKKLPEYQIKEWNETTFDIESNKFVKEAYRHKKYAFVADYVRLYVLYNEGGIYMDTDVKVFRTFDDFLAYSFFTSIEKHPSFFEKANQEKIDKNGYPIDNHVLMEGMGILSAVMGCTKGLPYMKDCLEYYNGLDFDLNKNTLDSYIIGKHITMNLLKYGFRFCDEKQLLQDNMLILPSNRFVGNTIYMDDTPYALHCCSSSWKDEKSLKGRIRDHFPAFFAFIQYLYQIVKR